LLKAIILNDSQVYRVTVQKQLSPKQSKGCEHVKIGKYKPSSNKVDSKMPSSKFICPNCNSKDEGVSAEINPIAPNTITELVICESCKSHIPSHIAYRWNKMTITMAREEWKKYKTDIRRQNCY